MFPKLRVAEVPTTVLLNLDMEYAPDIRTVLPNTLEELCLRLDGGSMQLYSWNSELDLVDLVRDMLRDLRSHSPVLYRL